MTREEAETRAWKEYNKQARQAFDMGTAAEARAEALSDQGGSGGAQALRSYLLRL